MSNEILFYIATAIFLLGVSGLFFSRDLISSLVSSQVIVVAAFINFINFSFIAPGQLWDKVFLFSGFMTIYLFIFGIILSIHMQVNTLEHSRILFDYRLLIFRKSDWWGEDK